MGTKYSHSSFTEDDFDLREWERQGKIGNTGILFNRRSPYLKIEQYAVSITDQTEFNKAQELYLLRKNDPEFVATKFSKISKESEMCSKSYHGYLYTERIPLRLSNITHIPFPDVLHVYNQAFNGYQRLARCVGPFRIDEECLGVNNQHVLKVWFNPNFEQIEPLHRVDSELAMLRNIVSIIQGNTDESTMPKSQPSFSKFLYRESSHIGFGEAKRKLQQYANYFNRGVVPNTLNCVARAGGAQNIRDKYIDSGQNNGYYKHFQKRNSHFQQIPQNHQKNYHHQTFENKNNEYRPSNSSHNTNFYTPEKKVGNNAHNPHLTNSEKIFTGHRVGPNYNPATYFPSQNKERIPSFTTPLKINPVNNYKQSILHEPNRILSPQNHSNTSYIISSPPHSAYNTYQQYQLRANHSNSPISQKQDIFNRPASRSVTINTQDPYKKLSYGSQENFVQKNKFGAFSDEKKITPPIKKVAKIDHARKKSQFDMQNDHLYENIKITNTPPQKLQHIESILMNSRQTQPHRNTITFQYRPLTFTQSSPPQNPINKPPQQFLSTLRKGSVQLNFNQPQNVPKNMINNHYQPLKLDKFEKFQKFSPQQPTKNKQIPKKRMSSSYVDHCQFQKQSKDDPLKCKFDQYLPKYNSQEKKNTQVKAFQPFGSFRPKSYISQDLQNKAIMNSTFQRTSLVDRNTLQKIQPVKVVHKNIIQAKKQAQLVQLDSKIEQKDQKKLDTNTNEQKIKKSSLISSKQSSHKNIPDTDRNSRQSKQSAVEKKEWIPKLQIDQKSNPRKSDVLSEQFSELSWGKFDVNMKKQKSRDTARSNTPMFGSTQSKPHETISLRSPQLSFNQADQIISNSSDRSFPRHTFESSATFNNEFSSYPRNTFQTANFTVSQNSNNFHYSDENQSSYRPTATYNRFSDEIDDDSQAPKFGAESEYRNQYAIVPNTGYDYGVSKNYSLLNTQNNLQVSEGESSPQDDQFFQKNVEKKGFSNENQEEEEETPIPLPVYENHNFFDLRHNREVGEVDTQGHEQSVGYQRKSSKNLLQNVPRDITGSKNKLASPDQEFLYQYRAPENLFNFGGRQSYRPSFSLQSYENYRSSLNSNQHEEEIEPIDKYRASVNAYNCYEQNNFFAVEKNETDFVPKYEYHQQKSDEVESEEKGVSRAFKDIVIEDGYSSYNMGAYEYGTHIGLNPSSHKKMQNQKLQMNGEQINNIPHVADDYSVEWGPDLLAGLQGENLKKSLS